MYRRRGRTVELEEVGPRFQLRRECPLLSPIPLNASHCVPKCPQRPSPCPLSLPDPPGDPGAGGRCRRGVALAPVHGHGPQAPPAQRHLSPPGPPRAPGEPPQVGPTWRAETPWAAETPLHPPGHVGVSQNRFLFVVINRVLSMLSSVRIGRVLLQPLLCWGGPGVRPSPNLIPGTTRPGGPAAPWASRCEN